MHCIRDYSIGTAHANAILKVARSGRYLFTEDKEHTVELHEPLNVLVTTPMVQPRISPKCTFGPNAMEKYVEDLLTGGKGDFVYTYHDRLFNYPFVKDGITNVFDQIGAVMLMLETTPETRRAQAITWIPPVDMDSLAPPCLQRIQFLIRNNKLNMHVDFRSRDILSAMGPNMYALTRLQEMIARTVGVEVGYYSDTSISAHIYYKRDIYELKKYYPPKMLEDEIIAEIEKCSGKSKYFQTQLSTAKNLK